MRKHLGKRGQSTLEYAVLIVVIIAALIAMQVYLKRGIQGRMKESSDQIGEQFSPSVVNRNTFTYANTHEVTDAYGSHTDIINQFERRNMQENLIANAEYWGK